MTGTVMMSSVDLNQLKAEIDTIGERIKSLKSATEIDKDAIGAAVEELLAAKKKYAGSNNGIGVDGKPYQEPLTKAQKKAKEKAEKAAKASQIGAVAKQETDPNSVNAQKKAAKKAEKAAKKKAMKAGAAGGGGGGGSAAGANVATVAKPSPVPPAAHRPIKFTLQPLQVVINPNASFMERPVVALSAAILTNSILDLTLTSDHRIPQASLGLSNGSIVVGDFSMARYLVRRSPDACNLIRSEIEEQAVVDSWIDYAQSLMKIELKDRILCAGMTLEYALQTQTYLVGTEMTLADLCMFSALGFPSQAQDLVKIDTLLPEDAVVSRRWISMMRQCPAIKEATQLAVGITNNSEAVFDTSITMEPLVSGMNPLEGAVVGKVVTRFPPEPSGYLHIGHSKAVLLNDYYARRYKGRLIVRFDDTNPSKEKEEFQESIVQDLGRLGVKPDMVTYTSDYFRAISGYAEYLIENGLAYMDDTPQEQMKTERTERKESKHRRQSREESMKNFRLMCSGSAEGAAWCLRAKIDMKSDNGTMRDPVLFRQNLTPHHRTGTTFKAYPTYDLACPIVDSVEGVTHALRTTEYNDRDEQYQWILKALGLRRVRIHSFARMNFTHTVLSKRKLTWFVENGYVTGWNDARFPTVQGVVRRGIDITALRNFIYSQGASRRVVNMVWTTFWAENKKEIDKRSKRYMAIDKEKHVELTITNAPREGEHGFVTTSMHPKDPSLGTRVVRLSSKVLLEEFDAEGIKVDELIVLMRWGVVKITKVDGGLEGIFVPDGDFKAAEKKLSWIANVSNNTPVILTEFDNLVSKEKLEEEDNFADFINPDTLATTEVIGDAGLKTLHEHDIIQLERRGYYRVDRPYVSNDKPLTLYMIPDGKSKAMSGLAGKLAHH